MASVFIVHPYRVGKGFDGGSVRACGIANAFDELGYRVTFFSPERLRPKPLRVVHQPYRYLGRGGYFFNPSLVHTLQERSQLDRPDFVVLNFPYPVFDVFRAVGDIPVFYHSQNVEADRFRQRGSAFLAKCVAYCERILVERARGVFAVSKSDQQRFAALYGVHPKLLPNGVCPQKLGDRSTKEQGGSLFVGAYTYPPNREACDFLVRLWPKVVEQCPSATLKIVGKGPRCPPSLRNLEWLGEVEEVHPVLSKAKLALAPIFSGGGTRLKILEALHAGTEVLATPYGAQGIEFGEAEGLYRAEPAQFLGRWCELLDHRAKRPTSLFSLEWKRLVGNIEWENECR